ncbi:hypothetical protein MVEN_02595700 [Mycena venus]|uniref:Uncharacterized protein n=1 Tax=Mycena venus TaxID=2733690 RepID=A0A8H6U1I1_9AGAR|nr:hypothetical protein MVEN_02595700 [Mycena venus]
MPKLPDSFSDWFKDLTGQSPSAEVLTHCRRELMHAIWRLLLDGEFIEACKHGIVILCPDGISRRFYFRVFTYSADYPEKVLLATIHNLGRCPCPRCLVTKDKLDQIGTVRDNKIRVNSRRVDDEGYRAYVHRARDWIYRSARGIRSKKVETLLAPKSLVPTTNAFSSLTSFGLSIFDMLVPDLMHEFELGVWKATFTHLVRILVANPGGDSVQGLNDRYRQVPTFGRATIRRFTNNVSAMKKLAARNFEDLLQCALAVFEELLDDPVHDKVILDLIFTLAFWHSLAKLRLHTDLTVNELKEVTRMLGRQLRHFTKVTCAAFVTRELPREEAARGRRTAKKAAAGAAAGTAAPPAAQQPAPGARIKKFNMETYKGHSLADYAATILFFGTTDSYSTQPGELEHRRVKRYYARTNKNDATGQMTQLERRETALLKISRAEHIPPISTLENPIPIPSVEPEPTGKSSKRKRKSRAQPKKVLPALDFADSESLPYTPPEAHYHISLSRNFHCNIPVWLAANTGDPALKEFLPKLQEHLLGRLFHPNWSGDGHEFSPQERSKILIINDRLYRHKVLRINYTTYDVRRGQDSMNPRTHADIMMLAPDDGAANPDQHPFTYARVLGVFHVDVVRYFRLDRNFKGGLKRKRLHRVEFLPDFDPAAFGFVNPDEVIRGSHLIPAFAHGITDQFPPSLCRRKDELDDWKYHYVNLDMFMGYLGGGVGHYQVPVPDSEDVEEETDLYPEDEQPEEDEPTVGPVEPPAGDDNDPDSDLDDDDDGPASGDEEGDEDSDEEGDPWAEEEEPNEDNLGPEDGEDIVDETSTAQFGYDDL